MSRVISTETNKIFTDNNNTSVLQKTSTRTNPPSLLISTMHSSYMVKCNVHTVILSRSSETEDILSPLDLASHRRARTQVHLCNKNSEAVCPKQTSSRVPRRSYRAHISTQGNKKTQKNDHTQETCTHPEVPDVLRPTAAHTISARLASELR